MKAYGRVKFFDSKKKKFGFIYVVKSEFGVSEVDAIFFDDDRRGEWGVYDWQVSTVLFDLKQNGSKYRARNVYPYLQAPDGMLFKFLHLFEDYEEIIILNELANRGCEIRDEKVTHLFQTIKKGREHPENLQRVWNFTRLINKPFAYELFFDHMNQNVFGSEAFRQDHFYSFNWFSMNGLKEFYTEMAIAKRHPVLLDLFTIYSRSKDEERIKEILPLILPDLSKISDPETIFSLLNYIDNPEVLLENNVIDISTAQKILLNLRYEYKNSPEKTAKLITLLLKKIVLNSWVLTNERLRDLLELDLDLEPAIAEYLLIRQLETTTSDEENKPVQNYWVASNKFPASDVIISYLLGFLTNPQEYLESRVTDNSTAQLILSGLLHSYAISQDENKMIFINILLRKIKANSWDITVNKLKELLVLEMQLEPEMVKYIAFNFLDHLFSTGEDNFIRDFQIVSAKFPALKAEIVNYSLFKLEIKSRAFFALLDDDDLNQKVVKKILEHFPTIFTEVPELFFRLRSISRLNSSIVDDGSVQSQLTNAVINLLGEDKNQTCGEIINYFLRQLEEAREDQIRLMLIYKFFFADSRIVLRVLLTNKGWDDKGRLNWGLVKQADNEKFNTSKDPELRILLAMLGILKETDIQIENVYFLRILSKLDSKYEFFVIKFLTWIALHKIEFRGKIKSFIMSTSFKTFPSIVFQNLINLENSDEKSAISALNKSLLDGYLKIKNLDGVELDHYFSLRVLVKNCLGRRHTSVPSKKYINGQMETVVTEYPNRTSPVVDYCEGKFWKTESYLVVPENIRKTYDLYWCRGAVCTAPNRFPVTKFPFAIYSIHELMLAFGINLSDLVYATIAGWMNRLKELLPLLKCNECDSHLVPISYVPNNLGYYATPLFMCPDQSCSEYQKSIRFTHCINCGTVLDSRELDTCSNGWLECPSCNACCPQHSGKSYTPHYRQT